MLWIWSRLEKKDYGTIDACKWLILGALITLVYVGRKKRLKKVCKKFCRFKKVPYLCTRNRKVVNASLAQLVEHDTLNVGVQGSSP